MACNNISRETDRCPKTSLMGTSSAERENKWDFSPAGTLCNYLNFYLFKLTF